MKRVLRGSPLGVPTALAFVGIAVVAIIGLGIDMPGTGHPAPRLEGAELAFTTCGSDPTAFCISSPSTGPTLYPGANASDLPLTFTNYLNVPITVNQVTVTFTNPFTTAKGSCGASALKVGGTPALGTPPSATVSIPGGVTVRGAVGSSPGTAPFTTTIALADSGGKQDACEGISLTMSYSGTATYTATTQTSLTATPATWGRPVTLTATVSAATPVHSQPSTTPYGAVTFAECAGTASCSSPTVLASNVPLDSSGVATTSHTFYPFANGPTATDYITASYTPGASLTTPADWSQSTTTQPLTIGFSGCVTGKKNGLTVQSGQVYCVTSGGTVSNGINVQSGGGLVLEPGSQVTGGLVSKSGAIGVYLCGSNVGGGTTLTNGTGPVAIGTDTAACPFNTISNGLTATGNGGAFYFANNNKVTGGTKVQTNNTPLPSS